MLPPMFLRRFASALTATLLVVCASFTLAGCGQKGELFLPAKNGSPESYAERKNAKSHFIFGSTTSKTTATNPAASAPAETTSASEPAATQTVTGGSAS